MTQPNAYSSPGDRAHPRPQQTGPPSSPPLKRPRSAPAARKGPVAPATSPQPLFPQAGQTAAFPRLPYRGPSPQRKRTGSTVSKRGHSHLRTRCFNESSWATHPCPRVAGRGLGFRTPGPEGVWRGAAHRRQRPGLRGHTPPPPLPPSAPPAGWSALCSTEVSGTLWPGCKHPLGGPYLLSPTEASQDPWVPRPPVEGPGMLRWYRILPPQGPT